MLRRDAALSGVLVAGGGAHPGRRVDVRVLQHDEGIGATELEHRLRYRPPARFGHLRPGDVAPGERDRMDPGVLDHRRHGILGIRRVRKTPGREPRLPEHLLEGQGALRNVGCVLEDRGLCPP